MTTVEPSSGLENRGRFMNRNMGDQVGDVLVWENEEFRVWDQTIAPGETVGPHVHEHDYFIVTLERTEVSGTSVGTNKSEIDRITEDLTWVQSNGEEHTATNHSRDKHWRNLIIEFKGRRN